MTGNDIGEGARAHRAGVRHYKRMTALWTLAIAAPAIAVVAVQQGRGPGSLPAGLAWVFALVLAAAIVLGTVCFFRVTDELDARDNLIAFAAGFIANAAIVIAWVVLYFGGVVGAPNAVGALVAAALVTGVVYLGRKLANR